MPHPSVVALMLLASATAASTPFPAERTTGANLAQITIRERIIIRIPSSRAAAGAPGIALATPTRWVEKKGPKCIVAGQMAGAIVNPDSVDLVMRGNDRLRAELDGDCAGLGFYGGFYVKPSSDGQVCAGRDSIRTRSGDSCTIRRFKRLVAKR